MKTKISYFVSLMFAIAVSAQTPAPTPAPAPAPVANATGGGGGGSTATVTFLPIAHIQQLRSEAEQAVRFGNINVSASTLVNGAGTKNYAEFRVTPGPDGVDLLEAYNGFSQQTLTFQVANVKESVFVSAALYGEDANRRRQALFVGSTSFKLVPTEKGAYRVPTDKTLFLMEMINPPQIDYPNAQYAYVQEWDEEGNVIRADNVPVQDGKLRFP